MTNVLVDDELIADELVGHELGTAVEPDRMASMMRVSASATPAARSDSAREMPPDRDPIPTTREPEHHGLLHRIIERMRGWLTH